MLLNLDIGFREGLTISARETAVDRLERAIRERHRDVTRIFLEAESLRNHRGSSG